jgi:hypothetical protein
VHISDQAALQGRFAVINLSLLQYFPDLSFGNLAAIHPANSLTGENEMFRVPFDRVVF